MINAVCGILESLPGCHGVSKRKRSAIFEVAARFTLIAEKARENGSVSLEAAASVERRRALRFGLEHVAQGGDRTGLDAAFARAPFMRSVDPGDRLEAAVVLCGMRALLEGEHPFMIFRRMTAYLGAEFFPKADAWILARIARRRRPGQEELLIPGDLPDVLQALASRREDLERVVRIAGRDITAAALAGCPRESFILVRPVFGKIGAAVLEDTMTFLRKRLSGDEIADAQGAFLETVHDLAVFGTIPEAVADEEAPDAGMVRELTQAILETSERQLRIGLSGMEGRLLACAMQGMEPSAHERILASLGKREEKRILDSIDASDPLSSRDVIEAGKELARLLLAAPPKAGAMPATLRETYERIRDRR